MTTTISPGLGHAVLTQQGVGATPGYDAIDFRRLVAANLQEGVVGSQSYMVTQRAAGATMTVDIAANSSDGIPVAAYVTGDAATFQGLYPVPPNSAVINEVIATANASLPRIDRVVLEVLDNVHDSSGFNLARTRVISGTASSGATLDNLTGVGAVPNSCLLLADVLVGAGVTSITNGVIRDRRRWARGAFAVATKTTNSPTVTTVSPPTMIDSTNLNPRIECSGVPIIVTFTAWQWQANAGGGISILFDLFIDGVSAGAGVHLDRANSTSDTLAVNQQWTIVPTAGSHRIGIAIATGSSGTGVLVEALSSPPSPMTLTICEEVRQVSPNNSITTG